MRRVMNKRGASRHIEMVLASVLFITFVFFVLIFLKPYDSNTLTESLVENIHDAFRDNVSTNLTSVFLKVDSSAIAGTCFSIDLQDLFGTQSSPTGSSVENTSGEDMNSAISSYVLSVDDKADTSYYVKFSSEFVADNVDGCEDITDYELGGIEEKEVMSDDLLENIQYAYENDYDNLKQELNIPSVFDFNILSEEYNMERTIPSNINVISTEYIDEVVYSDGDVKNIKFNVQVWQ